MARNRTARLSKKDLRAIREFGKTSRKRGRRSNAQLVDLAERRMFEDLSERKVVGQSAGRTFKLLLWKYRHQIAPVFLICLLWLAGALMPLVHHGTRLVLVIGAILLVGVWLLARHWLDRRIERIYASVCLVAVTMWLAVTAAHGVGRPMPAILWLAGCALAGPWWSHYRIRGVPAAPEQTAEVRQRTWQERVARKALPGSALTEITRVRHGWTGTIELPPGEAEAEHAIKATALITSAYKLPIGSVSVEADPMNASLAKLLVVENNPLHQVLPWPGPSLNTETGLARIGIYADGLPVDFRFYRRNWGPVHALVSGATGSGKSTLLDQLAAEAAHSRLILVWVIDPKFGQSMPNWVDHADWYACGLAEARRMLRAATRIGEARNRHLGRVKWVDDAGRERRGKSYFDPSPDMPEICIFIDEAQDVLADDECRQMVEWLTQKGRSVGECVILGTQVPSVEQLGGSIVIRSQLTSGNVLVFRVGRGDRLSGQMAFDLPVDPSKLPAEFPNGETASGMGYAAGAAARSVAWRAFYPEDGYHWASTAPTTELDLLSIDAAGPEYLTRQERREQILGESSEIAPPAEQLDASDPSEPPSLPKSAAAVLAVIPPDGSPIKRKEIIARSGILSNRTVNHALKTLVDEGILMSPERGMYARTRPESH